MDFDVAQPRRSRDAQISIASQSSAADLALAERVAVIPMDRDKFPQLRDVGSSLIKNVL